MKLAWTSDNLASTFQLWNGKVSVERTQDFKLIQEHASWLPTNQQTPLYKCTLWPLRVKTSLMKLVSS